MKLLILTTLSFLGKIYANCCEPCEKGEVCESEKNPSKGFEDLTFCFTDIKKHFGHCGKREDHCYYNYFSTTCAWKFNKMTYEAICRLVTCRGDFKNGSCHIKPSSKIDVESKVWLLLFHAIKTIPPQLFDLYYSAFHSGNYFECFLILQRLSTCDSEFERLVYERILIRNKDLKGKKITDICFVDPYTMECACIEISKCGKRHALYLPSFVLCFEEFLCTSFYMDEMLLCQIDMVTGCHFRRKYNELLAIYFKNFHRLSPEARIIFFLRIKFFAFNAIGYAISHLSSGPKHHVSRSIIEKAFSKESEFYRCYAVGSGLLK